LNSPELPLLETGALEIRPERPEDFPVIAEVIRLAFDKTDGSEVGMIEDIRASGDYVPDLALVAVLEGRVVGHALFAYITLEGEEPVRVLNLGPIGVHPEFQRRGIGGALIQHGLEICRTRGEPLVMCLGHDTYYPRFGWCPAREFGIQPDWDAMMVLPLSDNLERFRGLQYPH
jgi:putative acetyltransferase